MATKFQHEVFGECELARIEGVNWVIRSSDGGKLYRILPENRQDFIPISVDQPTQSALPTTNSAGSQYSKNSGFVRDCGAAFFRISAAKPVARTH